MELNAGEIKKALKCCGNENGCQGCPRNYSDPYDTVDCRERLMRDAVSVIRELTEENGRLRAEVSVKKKLLDKCVDLEDKVRADTVKEMQNRIAQSIGTYTKESYVYVYAWFALIDKIAEEMLEGNNDNT